MKYAGDVYYSCGYFETNINPYEVIFYKRRKNTPESDLAM